jgi:hypothetical protein
MNSGAAQSLYLIDNHRPWDEQGRERQWEKGLKAEESGDCLIAIPERVHETF